MKYFQNNTNGLLNNNNNSERNTKQIRVKIRETSPVGSVNSNKHASEKKHRNMRTKRQVTNENKNIIETNERTLN